MKLPDGWVFEGIRHRKPKGSSYTPTAVAEARHIQTGIILGTSKKDAQGGSDLPRFITEYMERHPKDFQS